AGQWRICERARRQDRDEARQRSVRRQLGRNARRHRGRDPRARARGVHQPVRRAAVAGAHAIHASTQQAAQELSRGIPWKSSLQKQFDPRSAAATRGPWRARGKIDDVVLGCAMPEGEQGLNVARLISLLADLGPEVPAQTINRFCSSGLQAIAIAAGSIAVGTNDVVIAGGVESMTMVPMTGFHLSASPELMDKLPGANTPMGITAENVARRFQISRQMQDEFAYRSQMKARRAL